jgi:hypothetical protein
LAYQVLQDACWFEGPPRGIPFDFPIPESCRRWLVPQRIGPTPVEGPLEPVFLKECRRLLGESAYLSGHLSDARAAFDWLSRNADHTADRLRAQDFLERIAWKTSMVAPSDDSGGTTMAHGRSQVPPRQ